MTTEPGTPELQVTEGKAWRQPREEGYLIQLPSGAVARLRSPSLHAMMEQGQIPVPLVSIASEVIWTGEEHRIKRILKDGLQKELDPLDDEISKEEIERIQKHVPEWLPLAHIVARAAFVEPRIVDRDVVPEGDDEIALADLEPGDLLYVWRVATRGSAFLRGFRARQEATMEAVHDLPEQGHSAEREDAGSR